MILLDARPAGAWALGHFAGALDADLDRYLSTASDPGFDPAPEGRHPLPPAERWARQLGAWGIGPETRVQVYDGARGAMGGCRLWWMLKASGHDKVELLEGTLEVLKGEGRAWTTEGAVTPVLAPPYRFHGWSLPILDADGAAAFASDPTRLLIDVRSPERWRGETEALDPIAGHIPGSVNLFLENNLGADGKFKSARELRAIYEPLFAGRHPSRVAVHCGSGVSACHTLFALDRAGLSGAALYVGSYSQWCRTGRPVATAQGST